MIESCGRFRSVSRRGHGVLSKPMMLPANSQTTIPTVIATNNHIEPMSLLTTSAIRSRTRSPATSRDRTSLGTWR